MTERDVEFGPCCFCGQRIERTSIDPLSVPVATVGEKWQVWFAHARCFKERLVTSGEVDLSPVHF